MNKGETMKKSLTTTLLLVFLVYLFQGCKDDATSPVTPEWPDLNGEYLGQTLPGNTPVVFAPGIISAEKDECLLAAYPGGNELYYLVIQNINNVIRTFIYETKNDNGSWSVPNIMSFSGEYLDGYPAIHPDGSRFYFQSNRPIDPSESQYEYNIWYADRVGDIWSEPISMGNPINGLNHTSGPSVTNDGTLYFTIMAIGGNSDIYRSELINKQYQTPEKLPGSVNKGRQQFDSYIAPDESYLIYCGYERADSYGSTDLYISFRDSNGNWTDEINMGPTINTIDTGGSGTITADGNYIFYGRYNEDTSKGVDIYWFSANFVESLKP